jgi:Leucine-rich repeat (LRR) protein
LRKISAGYNYISTVKLTLPKLMELDLKNNYLTKVPYLNLFPNLRVLNVRANKIEELSFAYLKNDKDKDNAPTYYESKVEKLNFAAN